MRSAIFNSDRGSPSGNRNSIRARHASASPRLASTTTGPTVGKIKKLSDLKARGRSSSPYIGTGSPRRIISWNLDEMITAYQESQLLPPLLSPTLPDFSSAGSDSEKTKLDLDDMPLIHLSPPNSQQTTTQQTQNQPALQPKAPKAETTVSPVKKKARVRWVNKMADPKPRFLLRFSYRPDKYKLTVRKAASKEVKKPTDVTGLGISVKKKPVASPEKPVVERPSTPLSQRATPKPNSPKTATPQKPATPVSKASASSSSRLGTPRPEKKTLKKEEAEVKSEDGGEDFIKLKTHWIKVAKETKFISEKTEGVLSMIMELDSLILFAISYEYDDKCKDKMNLAPSDRYWVTLTDEIDHAITRVKACVNNSKLDDIKGYNRCLMAALYKFKAVSLKRMAAIYEALIDREQDVNAKLSLYQKVSKSSHSAENCIRASETTCPNIDLFIRTNLPDLWSKRTKNLKDVGNSVSPIDNGFYLPIGTYTHLTEIIKFFYHLLNEFIRVYNKVYKDDLIYTLKSGNPA